MTAAAPVLEMLGIHKTFAGTHALRDVRFAAYAGEVHALVGENGAGKSTLMKILGGACRPDAGGEIRVDGRPLRVDSPATARTHGISVIHQEFALAPNLSVAENVYLGCEPARAGLVDRAAMRLGCAAVLQRLGARFGPEARVSALSVAQQQLVEIARAVRARSRILVMDEPTTALSEYETGRLFGLIDELRRDGLAIIYISHRMEEIYGLANRVTVLRDGACIGTLGRDELRPDVLVRMMVGRDLSGFHKRAPSGGRSATVVLDVRHVGDGVRVLDCSFELHGGEVLALAGMVGAGRTELARMIFGACRRSGGEIRVDGRPVPVDGPAAAIAAGIAYLTEDRKADGLFPDMTLTDNVNLGVMAGDARGPGLLDRPRGSARAAAAVSAFAIRAQGPTSLAGSLSGGNQQKVLLARLLETRPRVLILDEPTRGVDIGAKYEIYQLIDALARTGVGIVVISSELPEVVSIADRVLVMRRGAIVGELQGADVTQERIVALAVAAAPADGTAGPADGAEASL